MTPMLEKLASICKPEIDALFKLPKIRIAKDKLILDPSFPKITQPKKPAVQPPAESLPPKTSSSWTPHPEVPPPFAI